MPAQIPTTFGVIATGSTTVPVTFGVIATGGRTTPTTFGAVTPPAPPAVYQFSADYAMSGGFQPMGY